MKSTQEIPPVVEMRNIKKNFGAVQALRGVDLVLRHNEVLGLIGDNAAGKSTLMKVLSGAYIPDEGAIFVEAGGDYIWIAKGNQSEIGKLKYRYLPDSRRFFDAQPAKAFDLVFLL